MCGIAGIYRIGEQPVPRAGRLADELLLAIESRGTHSTGWLAMFDSGKVQMDKSLDRASVYVNGRNGFSQGFRTLLLHTRYATTGGRSLGNAHPVINGHCAAVHNGTIYNHSDVFRQLALKRNASVDSEVIPAVVSWGGWKHAAEALSLLDGGMATAIVNNEAPRELLLARLHGYPLHYMRTEQLIVWASTPQAIEQAWRRTFSRKPLGSFVELPPFRLHRITPEGIDRLDIEDRYDVSRWDREVKKWARQQQARRSWQPKSKPTGGKPGGRKSPNAIESAAGPLTGTTAKKRRKRSKSRSARNASTAVQPATQLRTSPQASTARRTAYDAVLDGMWEDQIQDLMRWTGISRIEAEDEVLGYSPTRANQDTDDDIVEWLHREDRDWGLAAELDDDGVEWSL